MAGLMGIRRRMLDGMALPPLPSGYQRVKCIKTTGVGSNFDTGVSGDNTSLRFAFCAEVDAYVAYRPFFGNFVNGQTNGWRVILGSSNDGRLLLSMGNKPADLMAADAGDSADLIGHRLYMDCRYKTFSAVADNHKFADDGRTLTDGTANSNPIVVGNQSVNTSSLVWGTGNISFYYFRIYDDGTLIRNYVPCYRKSDNTVGMYDVINQTFNSARNTNTPFVIG